MVFFIAVAQGDPWEGFWSARAIAVVSYIASAIVGVPIHLVLTRLSWCSIFHYIFAGAISAVLPVLVIIAGPALISQTSQPLSSLYPVMAVMIGAGAVVATVFWLLARPDRRQT
ncbi:hypothetical protein [Sphingomonas sp. OTU376]|uniref:hypothetical protein n=1 Tax=Sphingomonas sp. OTU376 TaxID=3043863 RepID=UPI00313F0A54